jgi:hypothetical protein
MFKTHQKLEEHQQENKTCRKRSSDLPGGVDGINNVQWKDVEQVLKSKKGLKISETDKWFAIWRILFPGVRVPKSPCK